MSSGWPLRGSRTTHSTLFDAFVGVPARSVRVKKKAAAVSPDASAYGTRKPGLESDQAAAVHRGGAPLWIAAGTHRGGPVAAALRVVVVREPPHAANTGTEAMANALRTDHDIDPLYTAKRRNVPDQGTDTTPAV